MIEYLKDNYSSNSNGITLVELIISVALIGVVSTVLLSMVYTGIRSYSSSNSQIDSCASARSAYLYLEKQLKTSDTLYWNPDLNRLYVQDMEARNSGDRNMFNYYTLENGVIMKHKVYEYDLNDVIHGGKSQLTGDISSFALEATESDEQLVKLSIQSDVDGNKFSLESFVNIGVPIVETTD